MIKIVKSFWLHLRKDTAPFITSCFVVSTVLPGFNLRESPNPPSTGVTSIVTNHSSGTIIVAPPKIQASSSSDLPERGLPCKIDLTSTENCSYFSTSEILRNNLTFTTAENIDIIYIIISDCCWSRDRVPSPAFGENKMTPTMMNIDGKKIIHMKCFAENTRYKKEGTNRHNDNTWSSVPGRSYCHYKTDSHQQHGPAENDIINHIGKDPCVSQYKE